MDRRNLTLALALSMAIIPSTYAFGATAATKTATKKPVPVATVDGIAITPEQLDSRIKAFPAQYAATLATKEGKIQVLEQMINEQVLLNTAKKSGVDKSEDYKTQLEIAKDQLAVALYIRNTIPQTIEVSEAEAKQYFDANPAQFKTTERRAVQQILVATEADAKAIVESLKKGDAMDAIAKTKSQDPGSAPNGGYIGWITKGQTVPEFEQAAFGTKVGDTPVIAKSQFGFHVIKVLEIQPEVTYTFEQAKQTIQTGLSNQKRQALLSDNVANARKKAKIVTNTDSL